MLTFGLTAWFNCFVFLMSCVHMMQVSIEIET